MPRILSPGRNCWRVEPAQRAAVLVDGQGYFSRLEAALRSAQRSIVILGWDFDGRIRLRPEASEKDSPPLGWLLRSLVETRPDLEIRILVWSVAVVHAPGASTPLLFGAEWQDHPRLTLKLDTQHPLYAAHHQKVVVVDDRIAFVGGMDLTVRRWDTPRHALDDPYRLDPEGKPYTPVHDVQMVVDGEAARAVGELARDRWRVATGEDVPAVGDLDGDPWPAGLSPDFTSISVAIARTLPAWGEQSSVTEAASLTIAALAAAERSVYIEAQYMTAPAVGEVLAERLHAPDGPEVVVLMTRESRGIAERFVMGSNRDRLIRRLRNADRHGRLRVWYPCPAAPDGGRHQVMIHSKLIVIDDRFLRVGSSNLNNRSIGLDTECDLAIEAHTERERRAIVDIRDRLICEHLDAEPELLAEAVKDAGGSFVTAIERLNCRPRGLRPFEAMRVDGPTRPALGTRLLDPKRPFEPLWFLRRGRARK